MIVEYINKIFADRSRKNPSYSLRAFSRSLGVDSSTLSAILSKKRSLTSKTAKKLLDRLSVDDPTTVERLLLSTVTGLKAADQKFTVLSAEIFQSISSWEHYAILSLLEVKGFAATVRSISSRLGVPTGVTLQSLERLKKLDLVKFKSGRWVATGKSLATQTDVPNAALKSANRQYLEKALVSLEVDPVEIRDVTGITMAIDAKKLPIAKEMIRDFRRNLARVLETGNKSAVYRLNVQLFPISKEIKS